MTPQQRNRSNVFSAMRHMSDRELAASATDKDFPNWARSMYAEELAVRTLAKPELNRVLVISAPDRTAPDYLTVTLHGAPTEDRRRVVNVLAHLFDSAAEWDGPRPNVALIATTNA